ncbi:YSIRK-type signal peptide-containing protein [Streptococcus suis]|nr:YSIRK-type signal peptide-containing protein [Streptococcus suis]
MKKRTHYSIRKTKWGTASLALGTSLLLATANATTVLAETVTLTPDEQTKLDTFLGNQPSHGERTSLGKASLVPTPNNYTFPGIDNYTSYFLTGKKVSLLNNNPFTVSKHLPPYSQRQAVFKDPDSVELYEFINPFSESYNSNVYFIKQATVIYLDDNSEETFENIKFDRDRPTFTNYSSEFSWNIPIEKNDSRFEFNLRPLFLQQGSGYWEFAISLKEDVPYETIVTIDEELKTGQIEEDSAGSQEPAIIKLSVWDYFYKVNNGNYQEFTSDRIYNDVVNAYGSVINAIDTGKINESTEFDWGRTVTDGYSRGNSNNRQLRVGIDYTRFITEDGTELAPKEYGLTESKSFAGYKLAETREESNGDRTYVYKVTPPSSSSSTTSSSSSESTSTSTSTSSSSSDSTLPSTSNSSPDSTLPSTSNSSSDSTLPSTSNSSSDSTLPSTDLPGSTILPVSSGKRSSVLPSTGVVDSVGLAVLGLGVLAGTLTWRGKGQKRSK